MCATPKSMLLPSLECRRYEQCGVGPCGDQLALLGYPGGLMDCANGLFDFTAAGHPPGLLAEGRGAAAAPLPWRFLRILRPTRIGFACSLMEFTCRWAPPG